MWSSRRELLARREKPPPVSAQLHTTVSLVSVVAYSIAVMESLNCSVEMQTFEDSMLAL